MGTTRQDDRDYKQVDEIVLYRFPIG